MTIFRTGEVWDRFSADSALGSPPDTRAGAWGLGIPQHLDVRARRTGSFERRLTNARRGIDRAGH
jgi:hypothetical protein